MEIPAWMFFALWTIIGITALYLGIEAFDRTDLPNSMSPLIIVFFKHFLAISACHSASYSLVFRPKLKISNERYYMWVSLAAFPVLFGRIASESFAWYYPIYSSFNIFVLVYYLLPEMKSFFLGDSYLYKASIVTAFSPLVYFLTPGEPFLWYFSIYISNVTVIFQLNYATAYDEQYGLFAHFATVSSLFLVGGKTKYYFPPVVLFIAFFSSVFWAAIFGDKRYQKWLPDIAARHSEHRIYSVVQKTMEKNGKLVEFAVGMAGTILFQSFFRLTSFDHVVAFLYFAVAWLAKIAQLMCPRDYGIFNFFLCNVIVGSTVGQFGNRGTTWIAYGASLFLYGLRFKMESLSLVSKGEKKADVVVWPDILTTSYHQPESSSDNRQIKASSTETGFGRQRNDDIQVVIIQPDKPANDGASPSKILYECEFGINNDHLQS